jgi:NAD+ kinase
MLDLKRIGYFTRDPHQDYRLGSMRKLFGRAGIEMVELDRSNPDEQRVDLVMALGGDGTVLRALCAFPGVPVLAVNFGTLGFLTASDRDDLEKVLVRLLSDDYFIEERLTLQIEHQGEAYRCINELVVKATTHMVQVGVTVNGATTHKPRGDGLIVGTPTGSTGYLLSTGAPVITPDVDCIILKPLNEYSFSSRSLIMPGSAQVELQVELERKEQEVLAVVDGKPAARIAHGDLIRIQRSHVPARLIYFERDTFFRNLRSRLHW